MGLLPPGRLGETTKVIRLGPDIILKFRATKRVVLLELLFTWEVGMEEAHERNLTKYQPLTEDEPWLMKLGAEDSPDSHCHNILGITGTTRRKIARDRQNQPHNGFGYDRANHLQAKLNQLGRHTSGGRWGKYQNVQWKRPHLMMELLAMFNIVLWESINKF